MMFFITHFHISFFFFFHSSGAHRDLHSFPTRRSSDLPARTSPPRSCSHRPEITLGRFVKRRRQAGWSARTACRSEEHTSELQSRGHLVCRLLLEKKKKKKLKTQQI